MNIDQSFAGYLESTLGISLGQDLWIGKAPSSNKVQDNIWWIISSGGDRVTDNVSGEAMKVYSVEVYCRSRNYKSIYDQLQDLEVALNCDGCVQLDGYETVDIKATTFPIDDDLDGEDRKVGLLQASLMVYQVC